MSQSKKKVIDRNLYVISTIQKYILVMLRIAIGWHFLYEGIAKLYTPDWSSAGYLEISRWIFSDIFHWIAANPMALKIVDLLNIWGLILIGLGLMLGCFTLIANISAIILILFYYIANPPLIGFDFGIVTEGNYLVVDKNFVELCALCVIAFFPTGTYMGLDRFILRLRNKQAESGREDKKEELYEDQKEPVSSSFRNRREMIKSLASLPFLGAFVFAVIS